MKSTVRRIAGLLITCSVGLTPTQAADAPSAEAVAKPVPVSIADVYDKAVATAELTRDLAGSLRDAGALKEARETLESARMVSDTVRKGLERYADVSAISYSQLLDLESQLKSAFRDIESARGSLTGRVRTLDRNLDRIADEKASWATLRKEVLQRQVPPESLAVIERTMGTLDELAANTLEQRDQAVQLLDNATNVSTAASRTLAQLAKRRNELTRAAERAGHAPLWALGQGKDGSAFGGAAGLLAVERNVVVAYFLLNARSISTTFVLLLLAAIVLLRWSRRGAADLLRGEEEAARILHVLDRPVPAALVIAVLGTLLSVPDAPLMFRSLGWIILPLPAAIVCVELFGRPIRNSIYTLAAALMLLPLRGIIEDAPLADRLLVLLQVLSVGIALTVDARRGRWEQVDIGLPPKAMRGGARLVIALLTITAIANIVGYVQLSKVLRDGVLGGLGLLLIFAAATQILYGVALGLLHAPPLNSLLGVRTRSATLLKALRTVLSLTAAGFWLFGTLSMARLLDFVLDRWQRLRASTIEIGSVAFTTQNVLSAILVLLLTWLAMRVVRFVLDVEVLPRLRIAGGLHFVISRVVRYLIAVAGFVFALAVLGIDLTKVTVLAGALGVGVGLGLQNIANNFFSGLILLFERPVQVGDLIVVNDMMGEVRRISIRSTTVRTFDGAEVIVPNGDLISKSVTNWTLSDRQRRAEIDVGVAYGSNPEQVIAILKEAADHPDVLKAPEPTAVLRGFGDNSLDFRLYLWVTDISNTLSAPSAVRRSILEKLTAAGIEIPFPQRDVHIRTPAAAAPGAAPASQEPSGTAGASPPLADPAS